VSLVTWIGVAGLGGCGALARFLLDAAISGRAGAGDFPLGTLAVNASGSLLLGLLSGLAVGGSLLVIAGAATLGSYTTFSTWTFETQRLVEDADVSRAGLNLAVSLAVGLGAAALGRAIGAHL
jgi:CrcB protein